MRRRASAITIDRKSTRLNSSHLVISYAVFCLKKKKKTNNHLLISLPIHNNEVTTITHIRPLTMSIRSTCTHTLSIARPLLCPPICVYDAGTRRVVYDRFRPDNNTQLVAMVEYTA